MTSVIFLHGHRTVHPTPALDSIQLHAQAENALCMALHYLRLPTSNIPGAVRKAVQALAALNQIPRE